MWAIDHVKPITKGGSHMLANLRPICEPLRHRLPPYLPPLCGNQVLSGRYASQSGRLYFAGRGDVTMVPNNGR
jgi:hypothetical protein